MKTLAKLACLAGYQIITDPSPWCAEITGEGRWHILERECYRLLKRYQMDTRSKYMHNHVTVILRDPLGGRELIDLGGMGERRGTLPSCAYSRHQTHLHGVTPSGRGWASRVTYRGECIYLGTFNDEISAGMAHDRYVIEHGINKELNFPHMLELLKRGSETVAK